MKLTFLGTGAAICIKTPENEIKEEQRRCSSMLVDENILVDIPFQCVDFAEKLGVDISKVTDLFITHSHSDHFQKSVLLRIAGLTRTKLNVWCQADAIENLGLTSDEAAEINLTPVEVMDKWETGGATVTALPANHLTTGNEQPLHYVFEKDGKSLFYGCDGGWFMARTWEYMRKIKLDAIVLDATVGDDAGNFRIGTHNSIPMLKIINAALLQNGIMDENGVRIANHIAPSVYKMTHAETANALAELGMVTAYDGLTLEI